MEIKLFNKNSSTIIALSKLFLSMEIQDKVPTFEQLSKDLMVARGTIQNSIKILQDEKAIEILPRGRKGTFLVDKDIEKLIYYANIRSLLGAMSLPYSKIYEGLATGLISSLKNKYQIPVNMSYMRDATQRIDEMLDGRYDFIIISKLSAEIALKRDKPIKIVKDFGPKTYLSYHVIVFADASMDKIQDGMTVGLASNATSQNLWVKKICKDINVNYKEIDYNNVLAAVKRHEIDATVWNRDEINNTLFQLNMVPIYSDEESTDAVLVVDANRKELVKIFEEIVDIETVTQIQKAVVEGKISPKY
ncbi:MAG: GntR family transcriptional regulator YhfZ [Firmicutes bacterium]|nr:GntR family transcriptional regulator YhfZ [Bacillota bacterium]